VALSNESLLAINAFHSYYQNSFPQDRLLEVSLRLTTKWTLFRPDVPGVASRPGGECLALNRKGKNQIDPSPYAVKLGRKLPPSQVYGSASTLT
jgi:hypothetical protein